MAKRLVDQRQPLADHLGVPARPVLIVEKDDLACRIDARCDARILKQHQRQQPHDLGLGRKDAQEQPAESDRLLAQHRRRLPRFRTRRIALVKDEVDHRRHRTDAFRSRNGVRRLERPAGCGDLRLGARDPLLHRCFRDEEGARDLRDGEAGDNAQRQRHLVLGRQRRVGAHEEQAQYVVAIVGAVETFGERRFDVVEVRQRGLVRQRNEALVAPHRVDADIAPDEDQPGRRIARGTVLRPVLQRPQARLLKRLFRAVEIAEVAQQGTDRLWAGGGNQRLDGAGVGHEACLSLSRSRM